MTGGAKMDEYNMAAFERRSPGLDRRTENGGRLNHTESGFHNRSEPGDNAEKERFLPGPVKLSPGWEATNRSESEMNFKSPELNTVESMLAHPPFDRLRLVFLIMVIHGIGTLTPWNMFITAKAYFEDFKLNVNTTDGEAVEYRTYFLNYLGITAQIPNLLLAFINMSCQNRGGSVSMRIILSLLIMTGLFVITVILAMVDSTGWPAAFFWITMVSVVVLNMANGMYQNSIYGVAAILPMKYTNAVVLGSNISGTLTAVINIIAIASAPDLRVAAIYYFITAIFILLIALDSYFLLPLLNFYKHYKRLVEMKHAIVQEAKKNAKTRPPYWKIFNKIKVQLFSVWFVFFITLTLFPAIQANVKRIDPDFPVSDKYWAPIFCFLNFNFFAMLGNLLSEWVKVPGPRWVWLPIVIRGLFFVPFLVLCNYQPGEERFPNLPLLINHDIAYIVGASVMAFTSGYFSSLTMMYGPKLVSVEQAGVAGMMMSFALICGVFGGALFSLALAKIIQLAAS